MVKLKNEDKIEYLFLLVALCPFVRRSRNSSISSVEMEFSSLVKNVSLKRKVTCSPVLTVFFLGICTVILQMMVDCFGNFHGRTSIFGIY